MGWPGGGWHPGGRLLGHLQDEKVVVGRDNPGAKHITEK